MNRSEKAKKFKDMHASGIFLMPNCWDAASAAIFASVGFEAIATASAAIAWVHGKPDGENISKDEMIAAIGRIVATVDVPVTADIERGYGETAQDLADTVWRVITAGAVGINIEDRLRDGSLRPARDMAERIAAARGAGQSLNTDLVINARPDVYLAGQAGSEAFDETVRRAKLYLEAGADCIYVIGAAGEEIAKLASAIPGPMNVLGSDHTMPSLDELGAMGVRRVSMGPRLMQRALADLEKAALRLRESGEFSVLEGMLASADVDARVTGGHRGRQ